MGKYYSEDCCLCFVVFGILTWEYWISFQNAGYLYRLEDRWGKRYCRPVLLLRFGRNLSDFSWHIIPIRHLQTDYDLQTKWNTNFRRDHFRLYIWSGCWSYIASASCECFLICKGFWSARSVQGAETFKAGSQTSVRKWWWWTGEVSVTNVDEQSCVMLTVCSRTTALLDFSPLTLSITNLWWRGIFSTFS